MISKISRLFNFFKYRLSRKIVLFIFASIVLIETIILIPSYYRREEEMLSQLEKISTNNVETLIKLYPEGLSEDLFLQKINEVKMESMILGVGIYNNQGKLIKMVGEKTKLTYFDIQHSQNMKFAGEKINICCRQWDGNKYEAAWIIKHPGLNYILIVRHDAMSVKKDLFTYTGRIIILIFIISIFVTLMMIIVLNYVIINPILQLRDDLMLVGENLNKEEDQIKFNSLKIDRKDELGEVLAAFNQMFERVYEEIKQRKEAEKILIIEQEKSEKLLLNILPESIALQLKQGDSEIAQRFTEVTILFADIVGFTELSSNISAEEIVKFLNEIFSAFDQLTEKYELEKIKTIGDAYMLVGGLPKPNVNHGICVAEMALEMQDEMKKFNDKNGENLSIRIGINTGCVVAGVIGTKKFIYDLWGDAVNTASRMESHGIPGKIQVTESTYQLLKNKYIFVERGVIEIKGKGEMKTYLLIGKNEH